MRCMSFIGQMAWHAVEEIGRPGVWHFRDYAVRTVWVSAGVWASHLYRWAKIKIERVSCPVRWRSGWRGCFAGILAAH